MNIAYEYRTPTTEQLNQLGWDAEALRGAPGLAVTAYDGEEAIGFGCLHAASADLAGSNPACSIQVHPAYMQRQIDTNIRKLLQARSLKPTLPHTVCV